MPDEDNKAFEQVMDAFRLPKETEEEKETRNERIENATIQAAAVPSRVIETCQISNSIYKNNHN